MGGEGKGGLLADFGVVADSGLGVVRMGGGEERRNREEKEEKEENTHNSYHFI